jgi:hypothetical protein
MTTADSDSVSSITFQGFSIKLPSAPSGPGQFATAPTPQVAAQTTVAFNTTVLAQFQWVSVYEAMAETDPLSRTITVTSGVTNTQSETQEFALSIGLTESADFDGIGASLNESFTETTSTTTSISLDTQTSISDTYTVNADTTTQGWQLYQYFVSLGSTGFSVLQQNTNLIISLSYPSS